MTLIACTLNHKVPFIVGDLLISSDAVNESVQLPTNTININQYLKPNNYYPIGLYQKIYIIKKNLCVALAGDVREMKIFLNEMKMRFSYWDAEAIKENHVRTFIEEYDLKNNFAASAFFIMLIEHEEERGMYVKQFWYPPDIWSFGKNEIFEGAYACGTGKNEFLYQLAEETKFDSSAEKGEIRRAIASNIGFIARLLSVERVSLNTINKNWGGGFETMFYDGNSFIKFDEIAYIVNQGFFDDSGDIGIPVPRLVMHYKYYRDLLLITSIEIISYTHEDADERIVINSEHYNTSFFIVSRIDEEKKSHEIELPQDLSFRTNRIALGYAIITKDNSIFAPSFFSESNDLSVTYKDKESIQIVINTKINDMIRTGAKDVFTKLQIQKTTVGQR